MKTTLNTTPGVPLARTGAGVGTTDRLHKSVAVGNDDRHGAAMDAADQRPASTATCGRRYQSPTGSAPCGGPLAHRRRGRSVLAASMECTWCGHVPQRPREAG